MLSLVKHPAFHFIIAGAVLFAAMQWIAPSTTVFGAGDPHRIVIDSKRIEDLRAEEAMRRGASPSGEDLNVLIEAAGVEEMLYREALQRGLDLDDAVVERRLVQDMRFLSDQDADETLLLRQAQALGLQSGDPIIRRRLIQKMRSMLAQKREGAAPSEDDMRQFFARHGDTFSEPPRARVSHIFFSGPQALTNAAAALEEIAAADIQPDAIAELGEPFLAGAHLPSLSEHGLAKLFGGSLARACMSLPTGRWNGQIPSTYGVHLVWIHERIAPAAPSFEQVRDRVRRQLEADQAAERLRAGIAELRAQYTVDIGDPSS